MLREDMNGDFVGSFPFDGRSYEYRVRGYGKPVLITASISPQSGAYAWRYLFECLAGTHIVYSLDIEGMLRSCEKAGQIRYAKLLESFLREIIGVRSTLIAGERELPAVARAAFEARSLVNSVICLSRGGAGRYGLRGPVIATPRRRKTGMHTPGVRGKVAAIPRFFAGRRLHSGALAGGKSPARVCEDIVRLLR